MTTDPIPDDIRKKANALADQWITRGHHDNAVLAEDFAQALMQERKRCVKIACDEGDYYRKESTGDPWDVGAYIAADAIRDAIRYPGKPEASGE